MHGEAYSEYQKIDAREQFSYSIFSCDWKRMDSINTKIIRFVLAPAEGGRLRPGQRWRKREGWKRRQWRKGRPGRRRKNWKRRKWNRRQRRTTTQIARATAEPPEEEEQEDAVRMRIF